MNPDEIARNRILAIEALVTPWSSVSGAVGLVGAVPTWAEVETKLRSLLHDAQALAKRADKGAKDAAKDAVELLAKTARDAWKAAQAAGDAAAGRLKEVWTEARKGVD